MNRRTFLGAGMAAAEAAGALAFGASMQIIDTHIHLFDPTRPQGVPWPPKNSTIYQPALPSRYRAISGPFGITGAIEVECSPWLEDNQWVLDVAAKDKIIVGTVGNLEPGKPGFGKNLERFHRNPLFRGIRNGNLWDRNFGATVKDKQAIADLKTLADAGLSLDTANPNPELMADVLRLSDRIPTLRIVLDHVPQMESVPLLREFEKRPQVYAKLSSAVRKVNGVVPLEPAFYRNRLDYLWGIFGEDRVVFGSDWPNSDQLADYPHVFAIVREFFNSKSKTAAEKYFWKNSVAAYRWKART